MNITIIKTQLFYKMKYFFDGACVKDVYKKVKIDGKRIDSCIRDSGGIEGDNENTFLKMEISAQVRRGVVVLPTMFVNAVPLRGIDPKRRAGQDSCCTGCTLL